MPWGILCGSISFIAEAHRSREASEVLGPKVLCPKVLSIVENSILKLYDNKRPEIVVVTGASAGVGRATVREFARRGAWVALLARSADGLEGARREVEAAGGRALVLTTDMADDDQVEEAAESVERNFGPID